MRRDLTLFWVSVIMLYFELVLIRWLSAEIRIFAYFHNLVLVFAFLGIGLGAAGIRKGSVVFSLVLMTGLAFLLRFEILDFDRVSQLLSLSPDLPVWQPTRIVGVDPLYLRLLFALGSVMLLLMLGLILIFFIPFGQLMGRLLRDSSATLRSYSVNLAGSLVGIWLFSLLSWVSSPPAVWFAVGGIGCLPLLGGDRRRIGAVAVMVLILFGLLYQPRTPDQWTLWSPYQKLTVMPFHLQTAGDSVHYGYRVLVNSAFYMQINNYNPQFMQQHPELYPPDVVPYDHYNIAYRFAGELDNVLIVGAGAGNDAAGALRAGARRITAVEIDPRIIDIGRALHPEHPYEATNVRVVNDDARSFFKKSNERYDLIIFGLLDSHTLSSSYSNIRLDNYVYTVESFQEARGLLKPNGILVLLFEVFDEDEFIGARIQQMLETAFGQPPVGFLVRSGFRGPGGTGFVAGHQETINQRVAADGRLRQIIEAHQPTFARWETLPLEPATDDWPYLYLPGRGIPVLFYYVFGVVLIISLASIRASQGRTWAIQWQFFLLGAAFLLMEVQNISKLALLFGTTWVTNTIVISAILITIWLANLYVMRYPVRDLRPFLVGLFLSLIVNWAIPLSWFSALPPGMKELSVGVATGLPFFFAGVFFSTLFSKATDAATALASNLLGAMAGGALESTSFILGIQALLVIGIVLYACAVLSQLAVRGASWGPTRSS